MIDKTIIKRNYFYIIYNILKDETTKYGKHLSVKEICDYIMKKYDLSIDKNTVSRVFDDLISFGFDIKKDIFGYYLDKRIFTDGELGLLIDGIETISVLPADEKIEIYEKICKIVGKKQESIDYYLYHQDDSFIEDELLKIIDNVYAAIGQNKRLNLFEPISFKAWLIDELTIEENDYLNKLMNETLSYDINPYQIFRSKDNEIYLLFYYKLLSRFVTGTVCLSSIEADNLVMTDELREEIDVRLLLAKDLTDFTSPKEYLMNESILTAEIVPLKLGDDKRMDFLFLLDECESYEVVEKDNNKVYNIKYKYKNEDIIIGLCTECSKYLKVLKGSRLYDELKRIYESLKTHYN